MNKSVKENLIPLGIAFASAALVMWVAASCSSLDPDNWVKVAVPEAVREPGQLKNIPLVEARSDFKVKSVQYQEALVQYAQNIDGGNQRAEQIRGFTEWLGASIISVGEATVPGWSLLGLGTGASFLFGALGIKKPGTITQKDGDDLYEEGRKAEREALAAASRVTAAARTGTDIGSALPA